MADRINGILPGATVGLEVIYYSAATGEFVDPVATPEIEITDVSGTVIVALTSTSVVKVSTGKYRYSYTIPADAAQGVWNDRWVATIGVSEVDQTLSFVVTTASAVRPAELPNNNKITVTIDGSIKDMDGNELGSDLQFYFTTEYSPFYSSVDRVRLDIGAFITDVTDDVIERMIFEDSMSADQLNYNNADPSTNEFFRYILREWVTCHVELGLLDDILAQMITGKSKRLGDLQISITPNVDVIKEEFKILWQRCDDLDLALKSGGDLGPGDYLKSRISVKGDSSPDRPEVGRLWRADDPFNKGVAAANTKVFSARMRRARKTFSTLREGLIVQDQTRGVFD